MIGTPNKGSPVEDKYYEGDKCTPAASDLRTGSEIAKSTEMEIHNPHTAYYTSLETGNMISSPLPPWIKTVWKGTLNGFPLNMPEGI